MCGRFTLRTPPKDVHRLFDLPSVPDIVPRYNIAPTQDVLAVRRDAATGQRTGVMLRWGLIPSWAEDPSFGQRTINARAEAAASKPTFRSAFKSRRCLIVADGFYEWQKAGAKKQPMLIELPGSRPFAFAGLWDHWEREGRVIESCTILTTSANAVMLPIHDRMPVILPEDWYDRWLDTKTTPAQLAELPTTVNDELVVRPVSTYVNNPRNEGPQCTARTSET